MRRVESPDMLLVQLRFTPQETQLLERGIPKSMAIWPFGCGDTFMHSSVQADRPEPNYMFSGLEKPAYLRSRVLNPFHSQKRMGLPNKPSENSGVLVPQHWCT